MLNNPKNIYPQTVLCLKGGEPFLNYKFYTVSFLAFILVDIEFNCSFLAVSSKLAVSPSIAANVLRTGAVVHLWNTNLSANTNDKYKEKV